MKRQELTSLEVKEIFGYIIDNNLRLSKAGKKPVSIGLEGESGIKSK